MPTFNYGCKKCNNEIEEFVQTSTEKVFCECGKQREKLFTQPDRLLVKFIGSGFYCTDNVQKKYSKDWHEDFNQITTDQARRINHGRDKPIDGNSIPDDSSVKPIEGNLVEPCSSKVI